MRFIEDCCSNSAGISLTVRTNEVIFSLIHFDLFRLENSLLFKNIGSFRFIFRDIQINQEDEERLSACLRVIIKLFAIGEPIPVFYFGKWIPSWIFASNLWAWSLCILTDDFLLDTINKDFVLFLLNLVEKPSDDPDQEKTVIELIHFILVYNLQFKSGDVGSENLTINALEEADNPKIFSETLLLLFNRGSKQTYVFKIWDQRGK